MRGLTRRERGSDLASRISRLERILDDWMRSFPLPRPFPLRRRGGIGREWPGEGLIRVDQYRDGNTEIIRAELPGIDPDKDVELTVADGRLRIDAERSLTEQTEDKGYTRHEMRYGRLTRTLPLPRGVSESDITATYKDGILEVRIPVSEPAGSEPTKIEVRRG